ncbi:MAG: type II secretion system F family protein [Actinomycetes bacterium]
MQWLALVTILLAAVIFYQSLGESKKLTLDAKLKPRALIGQSIQVTAKFKPLETLMEIPDYSTLLWFAICAGESLENSLRIAVSRSSGFVSSEFAKVLVNVDLGALLQTELQNLAAESKSDQVRELASKLSVALGNGTSMAELLTDFVQSVTSELRSALLAKAGKNETKMMIPLVFVILPITVMFAIYPSLALIQNSFL